MASNINRVVIEGRLVRDPELKSTGTGISISRFTIASNKTVKKNDKYEDVPGFFDCISFGKMAEAISRLTDKGKRIMIDGRLNFSSWDGQDGKKHSKVEIYVEHITFIDYKDKEASGTSLKDAFQGEPVTNDFSDQFDDSSIPY